MPSKKDEQQKKRPRIKSNKFFDYFVGTVVNVIVNDITDTNAKNMTSNMTVTGILLDHCDEYIYLGDDTGVKAAIKKVSVSTIVSDGHEESGITIDIPPGSIQQ